VRNPMPKFILVSLLLGASLYGQEFKVSNPALQPYTDMLNAVLTAPNAAAKTAAVNELLTIERSHFNQFAQYAATLRSADGSDLSKQVQQKLANQVEQSRIDMQSGGGAGAGGSASAVAKAGLSSILNAAIESGAITQAINGNTVNVTGNVDSVARFLGGTPPIPYCPPSKSRKQGCGTPVLKDLGFSVSVDTGQSSTKTVSTSATDNPAGTPSNVNLLAGKNRFAGASLKYVFRNPRDVHSTDFRNQWNDYYKAHLSDFQKAGSRLLGSIAHAFLPITQAPDDAYSKLQLRHQTALLNAATQADLEREFASYLDDVIALGKSVAPDFDKQLTSMLSAYMLYLGNIGKLLSDINQKTVFSAEYNFQRPQGQPDTSAFRIMSSFNPFGPNGTLSINLAGTFYNSSSVSSQFGRWRDAQASLQLERRIGGDLADYPVRFSLAGYFQYMVSPGLISLDSSNFAPGTNINLGQSAAIALAPIGSIWLGEAKVTFKLKGSGAEIPISITESNRTDLIKSGSNVTRGHIGLNFDFGRLFGSSN
jgi:hypothetical protein